MHKTLIRKIPNETIGITIIASTEIIVKDDDVRRRRPLGKTKLFRSGCANFIH